MAGEGTVAGLGEFGLIDAVVERFATTDDVLLGPGDDAAVVVAADGRVVASTDLLVEGRHFRRDWSSAFEVGRKAHECALVGATVVGGDVVRAESVVIAVTALGDLEGRTPVTRSGAGSGDIVALAGRLGWSAAGLAVLGRGFRSPRVLADAHRTPEPPYAAGCAAALAGATSMIDISDGLVADAAHVARASGVVLALDTAKIEIGTPVAEAAAAFNADPLVWVLTGGEDRARLATFPPGTALPEGFVAVGEVRAGDPGVLVDEAPYVGRGGHDHFA